ADVHGAVVAYSMAEQALRLEVARQYPDVHLGPAYTWDHGIRRYQFNLGLTLPLLNRNAGAIGEAEARREEAGAHLEATVAGAWQEIDEAIRQWRLARARLTEARGPVYDAAQHIYAETARGFEAGANDRTELVGARVAQTPAGLASTARVLDPGPLIQLDADLAAASASLAASRAEAGRTRKLYAQDRTASARALEAAEAQAQADLQRVNGAQRRLLLEWGDGVARLAARRRAAL